MSRGDNSNGGTVQHPDFFSLIGEKVNFLFFLFKKIKKVLRIKHFENGGKLRFSAIFEKKQTAEFFNSFFVEAF